MGALALPSPWIPEDDLLLKNAIEAGASLESLAKGAVQFSRRFSIKELQDRWHALLYDPIVSMKAAERMVELERSSLNLLSKSNRVDNSKGSKISDGKRKAESVRKCYYAMRKRVCHDPFNNDDLNYLVGPEDNCFLDGPEPLVPNNMLGDSMTGNFGLEHDGFDGLRNVFPQGGQSCGVNDYPIEQHHNIEPNTMIPNNMDMKQIPGHNVFEGSSIQANQMCSNFEGNTIFNPSISDCETSFDHLQYTSPMPTMPDWKSIEGLSVSEMPDDRDVRGPSDYDVMQTEPEMNNQIPCDDLKISTGCPDALLEDLSETLFNFVSEDDEMLVIDGGKNMLESISTLLLDSPNDVSEERIPNLLEIKKPANNEDVCIDIPSNTSPQEKNDTHIVDRHLTDVNPGITSDTPNPTCASRTINLEFPEYINGAICCTLNTEHPEVPFLDLPLKPQQSTLKRTQSESKNSSFHGKDNTGIQSNGKGLSTSKKDQKRLLESHTASQIQVQEVGSNHGVDELGVKCETSRIETINGNVPRITSSRYGSPCQSLQVVKKELSEIPSCSVVELPSQEVQTSLTQRNQDLQTLAPLDCMTVEPSGEPFLSDAEEQLSELETDIPYFSDVESMILDMDLGPEDQDSFCSREVAIYQQENMKRAIIRWEQNARSYMQRALASHGALAILYGRHSKHYIKKAEVLLGRATDDVPVDIDLGREGRASKISRRQAVIKMEKDGVFSLKNTGKCSIYVNSKEIFPGRSLALHSNCLIEIRGMPFIFETNQALIKQYLDNAARKLADNKPLV